MPDSPALVSHLALVAPALAVDAWYRWRGYEGRAVRGGAAALYTVLYLAAFFPLATTALPALRMDIATVAQSVAAGMLACLAIAWIFGGIGEWIHASSLSSAGKRRDSAIPAGQQAPASLSPVLGTPRAT
jgi:hypothetical protein